MKRTPRRRHRVVWDRRGLPAKRIPAHRAGRCLALLLYWVKQNGVCVVTRTGMPAAVLMSAERHATLASLGKGAATVYAARRQNARGIFTLADEVFSDEERANRWMGSEIEVLGGKKPVDLLYTPDGVEMLLDMLHGIKHGMFG